jgi:CysZ protein
MEATELIVGIFESCANLIRGNKLMKLLKILRNWLLEFLDGLNYPLRAFGLFLIKPGYWKYLVAPAMLNLLLYLLVGGVFMYFVLPLADEIFPFVENTFLRYLYDTLEILLQLVIILTFLVFFLMTFTALSFVISIPFLDKLSLRFERERYGFEFTKETLKHHSKYLWQTTKHSIWIAFCIIFWTILLLPLNFIIPYVGFLPGLLILGYLFGVNFLIYSAEHRWLRWRELKRSLKGHRMALLGFGVTAYIFLFIPFVAVIVLPIAVIAGTMFFNERLKPAKTND